MKKEDLKVGDKFRIIKPKLDSKGISKDGVLWHDLMDKLVGKKVVIEEITSCSVGIKECIFFFPFESLEIIEEDKQEQKKNKIKRGDIVCVTEFTSLDIHIINEANLDDKEVNTVPKIGQIAEVTDKFKYDGKKYLVLSYHDETYIVAKPNVIKTIPQSIIL